MLSLQKTYTRSVIWGSIAVLMMVAGLGPSLNCLTCLCAQGKTNQFDVACAEACCGGQSDGSTDEEDQEEHQGGDDICAVCRLVGQLKNSFTPPPADVVLNQVVYYTNFGVTNEASQSICLERTARGPPASL